MNLNHYLLLLWPAFILLIVLVVGGLVWRSRQEEKSNIRSDWLAAGLLFTLSFLARASLSGFALPYQAVWDEVTIYPQALQLIEQPALYTQAIEIQGYGKASYGDLIVNIAAAGQFLGLLDGTWTHRVSSIQEYVSAPEGVQNIFAAVGAHGLPLQAPRLLLSFFNSFAPIGIYLALRRVFNTPPWISCFAAFNFAVLSPEILYYSSFILPDALATTLCVYGLLAAFVCIEDRKGRLIYYGMCGVLSGAILSIAIRNAAVLSIPAVAFFVARNQSRPFLRLCVLGISTLGGFLITSPSVWLDFQTFVTKVMGFNWVHDYSLSHRLDSLVYYLRGMFMPDYSSPYVGSAAGGAGLGLLVGLVALLGLIRIGKRAPRLAIPIVGFTILHFAAITPVTSRFTRHELVLYPLASIAAGVGFTVLFEYVRRGLDWLKSKETSTHHTVGKSILPPELASTMICLAIFIAFSYSRINYAWQYIQQARRLEPSQAEAVKYLTQVVMPGDVVGIIDILPLLESDLKARHIPYERIQVGEDLQQLKNSHITYVLGTDKAGKQYSVEGSLWTDCFHDPGMKLAEFGKSDILYEGFPVHDLYMFVARLP